MVKKIAAKNPKPVREGSKPKGGRLKTSGQKPTASAFVFQFPATILKWHDGDTVAVDRGAWPGLVVTGEHVRTEGINAPELREAGGKEATVYADSLAPAGTRVTLIASREDKYGRFLARIVLPDGSDFSMRMIEAGHAKPYMV